MINLARFFLHRSFLVNLICAFIFLAGILSMIDMKRDLIPQWEKKEISINVTLPGATGRQMEKFVTYPIEESIQSLAGIEEINSWSGDSNTTINIDIVDSFTAKQVDELHTQIQANVDSIRSDLPNEVERIFVDKEVVNMSWFSWISVLGFDEQNFAHQDWIETLKDKIRRIPGIVKVDSWYDAPQFYVNFDLKKLANFRLSPTQVHEKLKENFRFLPIGTKSLGHERVSVELINNLNSLEQIENVVIQNNSTGQAVRLKDVASVSYEVKESKTIWTVNNKKAASLNLYKTLDTDSIDLRKKVKEFFAEEQKLAPEGVEIKMTGDGAAYIERQLNVLKNNGVMGLILVVACLFVFLGLKTSLLTAFSIPLAYLATFAVLSTMGINIDLISVVGMILILGILVDDAIIVAEQYTQFMEEGLPPQEAALKAVKVTIKPVTGTIITTVVAFAPILFSRNELSRILIAIPVVVISALAVSWIESFFILPNHLNHFIKKAPKQPDEQFFFKLKKRYMGLLEKNLKWRYPIVVFLFAFMGFSGYFAYKNVPMKYDLRVGSEKMRINIELNESPNATFTQDKLRPLHDYLLKMDESRYSFITANYGRSWVNGRNNQGPQHAQITIRFQQNHPDIQGSREYVEKYIKDKIETFKTDEFVTLNLDKVKEGHESAKESSLDLSIIGKDEIPIHKVVTKIKNALAPVKGLKEVYIDPNTSQDNWDFEVNHDALQAYGLTATEVAAQIRQLINTSELLEVRHQGKNISVQTSIGDTDEIEFDDLNNLRILVNGGRTATLKDLGRWVLNTGVTQISHKNLERTFKVEISYHDDQTKKEIFQKDVDNALSGLRTEYKNFKFDVQDADKQGEKNKKAMNKNLVLCLVMILFILAVVLNSLLQPILIGMAIPFGVIGVIWAFYFHGTTINVMALIGIIGMAGVVVNDSLIMVDLINRKREEAGESFDRNDIIEGASSRLRAILLTSITTLGGVFPMAYGLGGDSGFTKPLALAMGWGLLFATCLTLFVIPAMIEIQRDLHNLLGRFLSNKKAPVGLVESKPISVVLNNADSRNLDDHLQEKGPNSQHESNDHRPSVH